MPDIIQEVIQREQKALETIENTEARLAQELEGERLKLQQQAKETLEAAHDAQKLELEEFTKKQEQQAKKDQLKLSKKLQSYDDIPQKQVDTVAKKVLKALK